MRRVYTGKSLCNRYLGNIHSGIEGAFRLVHPLIEASNAANAVVALDRVRRVESAGVAFVAVAASACGTLREGSGFSVDCRSQVRSEVDPPMAEDLIN